MGDADASSQQCRLGSQSVPHQLFPVRCILEEEVGSSPNHAQAFLPAFFLWSTSQLRCQQGPATSALTSTSSTSCSLRRLQMKSQPASATALQPSRACCHRNSCTSPLISKIWVWLGTQPDWLHAQLIPGQDYDMPAHWSKEDTSEHVDKMLAAIVTSCVSIMHGFLSNRSALLLQPHEHVCCSLSFNHSLNVFQSKDQVRCSTSHMAALHTALSWDVLHQAYDSPIKCCMFAELAVWKSTSEHGLTTELACEAF